jgi:hypothetical protein
LLLAVVAAVIGLGLYVIFDATSLEFWALIWLAATVLFIPVIRRQPRRRDCWPTGRPGERR